VRTVQPVARIALMTNANANNILAGKREMFMGEMWASAWGWYWNVSQRNKIIRI